MNWLTDNKIPIDDAAEAVFDWLLINAGWLFDGLAVAMEWLIDAILWVLQTPHPLIIIAVFGALTWAIQRNWKTPLLLVVGFLFILNQDYWEETTESLTLVLSACVVCMGVGVPIGIAAAHRPRMYRYMAPVLDLMQTPAKTNARRSTESSTPSCAAPDDGSGRRAQPRNGRQSGAAFQLHLCRNISGGVAACRDGGSAPMTRSSRACPGNRSGNGRGNRHAARERPPLRRVSPRRAAS